MTEILNIIEKAANSACRANAGDYEQDGLLFCGKCGTRKQVEAPWPDGTVHKVGCLCKCEQEKMEREEQARLQLQEFLRVQSTVQPPLILPLVESVLLAWNLL
jgi:hypothetical protein